MISEITSGSNAPSLNAWIIPPYPRTHGWGVRGRGSVLLVREVKASNFFLH